MRLKSEEDWCSKRRQDQIDQVGLVERTCFSHFNSLTMKDIESETGSRDPLWSTVSPLSGEVYYL